MGKKSEHDCAARQFYADAARPRSAAEECQEGDDPVRGMVDDWAEKLMRNGDVPRVYAQRCAEAVVGALRARDEGCAGGGMGAGRGREAVGVFSGLGGVVEEIVGAKGEINSKVSAGCLLLALGNYTFARSARDWAERRGLSHELVSNAVEAWQERLGLPRTSGQKSAEALKTYQDTNGKTKMAA